MLKFISFKRTFILVTVALAFMAAGGEAVRIKQYTSRSAAEAEVWQISLRKDLIDLLRIGDLIQNRGGTPFDVEEIKVSDKGSYVMKELEMNSTPTHRMKVTITIPKEGTKFPAVVCLHGHNGKLYTVYEPISEYQGFAAELAKSGYITITTVVSQHQIREPRRSLVGERVFDAMRLVDFLSTLPEVDSKKIGVAGLSLGGEMAMWLGALDTRIRATVSSGAVTRMAHSEKFHCPCWNVPGIRKLVGNADIYSLIAPRALQCQIGERERQSDFPVKIAEGVVDEIRLIYSDMKKSDQLTFDVHNGGHIMDVPAMMAFFGQFLK